MHHSLTPRLPLEPRCKALLHNLDAVLEVQMILRPCKLSQLDAGH